MTDTKLRKWSTAIGSLFKGKQPEPGQEHHAPAEPGTSSGGNTAANTPDQPLQPIRNKKPITVQEAEHAYEPPLRYLLRVGDPRELNHPVKARTYGIRPEHIPDLIRMATDDNLHGADGYTSLVWAPLHAWRILGKLRAKEAILPLIALYRRMDIDIDDWIAEEIPDVLMEIDPAGSLPPLIDFMQDTENGPHARNEAAFCICRFGQAYPKKLREICVNALSEQLEKFVDQDDEFNSILIWSLTDLNAVEAIPVIKRAFNSGRVDESHCGDLEDVLIDLGLLEARTKPRKPNKWTKISDAMRAAFEARIAYEESREDFGDGTPVSSMPTRTKIGRNEPCPCGSGKKHKKCCGA